MRKFSLYAKRLGAVLTIVLLVLQITEAGLTLWNHLPEVIAMWA